MTFTTALVIVCIALGAQGFPTNSTHNESAGKADLPLIRLPYGTWRATEYDRRQDIYAFRNIRFAAAPVGPLRWAKPAPPVVNNVIQDGRTGHSCYQSMPGSMLDFALKSGLADEANPTPFPVGTLGSAATTVISPETLANGLSNLDVATLMGGYPEAEDCLFLDLIVPGKALRGELKLPVINWIFGGAYVLGSKDKLYDGLPLIKSANGQAIYVAGNYRLGAFGFLAGDQVLDKGIPNAGLYDQRAVMEWIQKYISMVGGDPSNVSVWGESAGASSIMHHLTAFGGTQPAMFKRAVIESPANNPQYHIGKLNEQFTQYARLAGCPAGPSALSCLRGKDASTLSTANNKLIAAAPEGQFGFGPSVDGVLARNLPELELAAGHFQKDIESIIVTRVAYEASAFVPDNLPNDPSFLPRNLARTFTNRDTIAKILAQYPPASARTPYRNERERFIRYVETELFACHARYIASAYRGKAYSGIYGRGNGLHATDIRATFWNEEKSRPSNDTLFPSFASQYQKYLLTHALTGNPNNASTPVKWPLVQVGSDLQNVLRADNEGFAITQDDLLTADTCDFWLRLWSSDERR